jgi:hypothetical protein
MAMQSGKFYAEFTDYDRSQVNPWLRENVLNNLMRQENDTLPEDAYPEWYHQGSIEFIRPKLLRWLDEFDYVEWVSDVAHYDFVLLIDLLFIDAISMSNSGYPAVCYDINNDIAVFHGVGIDEAFDLSREDILEANGVMLDEKVKHNALYDAEVIRAIYNIIHYEI